MSAEISKVTVVGVGTMGAQIAVHAAAFGYRVTAFDSDPGAFGRTVERVGADLARRPIRLLPFEKWQEAASRVRVADDLAQALARVDLVVETVPEDLALKREVFARLDQLAPAHAILATSSSSIPISRLADATSRPEKCLNLHFYQPTVQANMVDVMGGPQTAPEVFKAGEKWVRSLHCLPLRVNREVLGFCFNRVWRAIKKEVLHMWAQGVVDHRDIDRAWRTFSGMPMGPFGMMDMVGLDVVYDIEMVYFQESGDPGDRPPQRLKEMIERGELGIKTGRGFYRYPDPEYSQQQFLDPLAESSGS